MGVIGKILKSAIKDTIREVQLEIYEGYTLSSNQVLPPGIDSVSLPDDQGVAIEIENNPGKMIQVGVYPETLAEPGETRIYSRDANGAQVSEIWLKKDGTITINSNKTVIITTTDPIELNGNTDNAVRYSALETAFDQLKGDHDDFVSAFNQHMHATAAVGPPIIPTPVPTVIPVLVSTADITGSKVDEVKLP